MNKDTIIRCQWCGDDPLYVEYHDKEWGRVVRDDRSLFEFPILESAQAGLAWITILRKREAYRKAFYDFDYRLVARMTAEDEARLMSFDGIVKTDSRYIVRLSMHACSGT